MSNSLAVVLSKLSDFKDPNNEKTHYINFTKVFYGAEETKHSELSMNRRIGVVETASFIIIGKKTHKTQFCQNVLTLSKYNLLIGTSYEP